MIYVRDLLKLDTFKDFELVSGENGLDRGVSWPNVAQTVSIREWACRRRCYSYEWRRLKNNR